jgi:hypothetical protein
LEAEEGACFEKPEDKVSRVPLQINAIPVRAVRVEAVPIDRDFEG